MRCCLQQRTANCSPRVTEPGHNKLLGFSVALPSRRATRALNCAALALLASPFVQANNVVGAWDPQLYTWPLIPVHSVLTPDMRIMSYGTDGIARQTG